MIIKAIPTGPVMANSYLVVDEDSKDALLIDAGAYSDTIARELKKFNFKYLILTHGHGDHTGGVEEYLKEFPQVKLIAPKAELEFLNDYNANGSLEINGRSFRLDPDIAVNDGDELAFGKQIIKFISTPGHTVGGMCVLIGDSLFTGDTLFKASIGRTDLKGGNFDLLISNIREKLFTLPDDTKVYPGHMQTSTIGYEKGHNPFV